MNEQAKVQEFLNTRGATPCPAMPPPESIYVRGNAPRVLASEMTVSAHHSDLERLAKAKLAMGLMMIGRRCPDGARYSMMNDETVMWHQWFGSEDFRLWCHTAGYDPDRVLRRAQQVAADGIAALTGRGKRKNSVWMPRERRR